MKKNLFSIIACSLLVPLLLQAQVEESVNRKKIAITAEQIQSTSTDAQLLNISRSVSILKPVKIKFGDKIENFFTLALNWPKSKISVDEVEFAYREKKRGKWGAWQKLPIDRHGEEESTIEATEMRQLDAKVRYIQLKIIHPTLAPLPADININLFNPVLPNNQDGAMLLKGPTSLGPSQPEQRSCPCPLPGMVSRDSWGAPRPCAAPGYATVTHMVVHHSAGVNTATNWSQVVLSIWDFHVNTRAYCDVAYNYLIDPNGVLYEGRGGGNNVVGAHFCATNTGTMGVCLLGNFQEVEPSIAMLNKLADVLAWKSCNSTIDPSMSSLHSRSNLVLNHICGHRDGCATECPGENVYSKLATVRTKVGNSIQTCNFTVGTGDIKQNYTISIIPNPAQNTFRLQLSNGRRVTHLEMYNLMGQLVSGIQFDALSMQVQCGNIPRGTYVLKILDEDKRLGAQKVVLQ